MWYDPILSFPKFFYGAYIIDVYIWIDEWHVAIAIHDNMLIGRF